MERIRLAFQTIGQRLKERAWRWLLIEPYIKRQIEPVQKRIDQYHAKLALLESAIERRIESIESALRAIEQTGRTTSEQIEQDLQSVRDSVQSALSAIATRTTRKKR